MIPVVFRDTDLSWINNLPPKERFFNPLVDISQYQREESERAEIYKLGNEFYSPAWGIKYFLNVDLFPFQSAIILALLRHKFPLLMLSRGAGKTYMLAVFAVYYGLMFPGSKIVLVSATFRQAKFIFENIIKIYQNSPILRKLSNHEPRKGVDQYYYTVNNSSIVALPMSGDKIRGMRSNLTLVDEMDAIPIEIFDVVIRGFSSTESSPFEKAKSESLAKKGQRISKSMYDTGNKIILSGTAGFVNGTLHRIYRQYYRIIRNKVSGYAREHQNLLGGEIEDDIKIDHREYCIIRYNYKQIPKGMFDIKMIHNARTTMPKHLFDCEYNSIFADDTKGFFKASYIREATTQPPDGFSILSKGLPNRQYILGVDPARTMDRFAIVVMQLGPPHKLVQCWTSQDKTFRHSTEKIREFLRKFNVVGIAMDPDGGGKAVEEFLRMEELMQDGDKKIYARDAEDAPESARKILYLFKFGTIWIDDANNLLRKNIEDRSLLFPIPIVDSPNDEAEDALQEIRDLKQELLSIEVSYTKTGKKHYDLMPADIRSTDEVVRHKDRYSSLLLANYLAANIDRMDVDKTKAIREKYHNPKNIGGWLEEFGYGR